MWLACLLAFADIASALTYYPNDTNVHSSTLGGYMLRRRDDASSGAGVSNGRLPSATGISESVPRTSNASLSLASSVSTVNFHTDVFSASIDWPRPTAIPHATECWSKIASWSSSSISWYNTYVAGLSWPVTSSTTIAKWQTSKAYTYYPTDPSTYKLCDGSARVNVRPSSTTTYFNSTSGTYTRTYLATPTFSPRPCDPTPQDCHIWHNKSSIPEFNEDSLIDLCGNPSHGVDQPCVFGIEGAVELIYFPVKEANANASLCSGNASTITASPTGDGLNAITTLGRTFTSGAVYMSIKALSAYVDGFDYLIGPSFTDLILTLSSSEVSSQCNGNKIATSLDFADLNWPVPASAYNCQNRCGHFHIKDSETPAQCSTIWSDVNPLLAIPTKITELSPLWATCAFEVPSLANYWFDPPIALQEQQVMAVPTLSATPESLTTPAAPSSRLPDPTPTNTGSEHPAAEASLSSGIEHPTETIIPFVPIGATPSSANSGPVPTEINQSGTMPSLLRSAPSETEAIDPVLSSSSTLRQTSHLQDIEISGPTSSHPSTVIPPAISILTEALSSIQSSAPSASGTQDVNYDPISSAAGEDQASPHSGAWQSGQATIISDRSLRANPSGMESQTMPTSALQLGSDTPATTIVGADGFTIAFSAIASNSQAVAISSQSISIGGPAVTISDHVITHGSDGIALISPSKTIPFTQVSLPAQSTLAAGSLTLVASPVPGNTDAVAVDGTPISVGGPAATISGNVISKASSGLLLHGSMTTAFADTAASSNMQQQDSAGSVVAAGSFTLTALSPSGTGVAVVIDGTTVSHDGPGIPTAGLTISYASSRLVLVGAQSTAAFSAIPTQTSGEDIPDAVETTWALGSLTFTAAAVTNQPDAISVHGTTLSRGGSAAVINHATLTMGPSGLELVKPLTSGRGTTLPVIASLNSTQTLPSLVTTTTSTSSGSAAQPADATATSSHSGAESPSRRVDRVMNSLLGYWILYIALVI